MNAELLESLYDLYEIGGVELYQAGCSGIILEKDGIQNDEIQDTF